MEHTFSTIKLVNTDAGNKMDDQILSDSLMSYIEKSVLEGISNETFVKIYQDIRLRRVQF